MGLLGKSVLAARKGVAILRNHSLAQGGSIFLSYGAVLFGVAGAAVSWGVGRGRT